MEIKEYIRESFIIIACGIDRFKKVYRAANENEKGDLEKFIKEAQHELDDLYDFARRHELDIIFEDGTYRVVEYGY